MFTGIIEELGLFRGIRRAERSVRMNIGASRVLDGLKEGDSIAVNGVCLSVVFFDSDSFTADVMPETLTRTNFTRLKAGELLNLERAMKASGRFDGHIVSGHIDGTAIIAAKEDIKNATIVSFDAPAKILKYIVEKGSVAVDGISLTCTFVNDSSFGVSLIPLTSGVTSLAKKRPGDEVNIECDIIGKYVERFVVAKEKRGESGITESFLREKGFYW